MRDLAPMTLAEFETAPFRFCGSTVLHATADAIFDELGDPSLWFPAMRRSVWRSGATSGVGAQREVDVVLFGAFREHMLAWDRGRRLAFTMTATSSPLIDRMGEDFRLSPVPGDPHSTRFEWTVVATPARAARPLTPAIRLAMRGMFALSARGLAKRTRWSAGRSQGTHAS